MTVTVSTNRDAINQAGVNELPQRLGDLYQVGTDLGFADLLNAMGLREARERTGLTNQVSHVHDEAPAFITAVYVTAGTPLDIISGAAPGAGEVLIEVDADTRVPTFTFNAATTSYFVLGGGPIPTNLTAKMAESR
jgi:hypothetical protein